MLAGQSGLLGGRPTRPPAELSVEPPDDLPALARPVPPDGVHDA
jgi:hypothetical protein